MSIKSSNVFVRSTALSILTFDLRTGSGPFHRAMRQGWWGNLGSPCYFLSRGQRWVLQPLLSELDLHWADRPDPWCRPCWSLSCWAAGCGQGGKWWTRATVAGRRGFLPASHGKAARPPPGRSSRWACCRSRRLRCFRTSCWHDPGLTGSGLLLERAHNITFKIVLTKHTDNIVQKFGVRRNENLYVH